MSDKAILTCALNGVLTDPSRHPVPFTPEDMAQSTLDAYNAGAAIVHLHLREQITGRFPSWDPNLAQQAIDAIHHACPDIIINLTTGTVGTDISGPRAILEQVKPELAAMNSGSLNYLKLRSNGEWAWPPMLFDNPVEKIQAMLHVMSENAITPECECFDTGIVRSLCMFRDNGMLPSHFTVSFVQGIASGMPARADLLPILIDEAPDGAPWQSIVIGREEVWSIHQRTAELGGHLRTGVEDTFYLPDSSKVSGNGPLLEQLARTARQAGREPATPAEARSILGL